jgi:hypothetical protein
MGHQGDAVALEEQDAGSEGVERYVTALVLPVAKAGVIVGMDSLMRGSDVAGIKAVCTETSSGRCAMLCEFISYFSQVQGGIEFSDEGTGAFLPSHSPSLSVFIPAITTPIVPLTGEVPPPLWHPLEADHRWSSHFDPHESNLDLPFATFPTNARIKLAFHQRWWTNLTSNCSSKRQLWTQSSAIIQLEASLESQTAW